MSTRQPELNTKVKSFIKAFRHIEWKKKSNFSILNNGGFKPETYTKFKGEI